MDEEDRTLKTIPRYAPIKHQKVIVAYGQANHRTMSVDDYARFKKRNSSINRWRKDNLSGSEVSCTACGWQVPPVFRTHARAKGQLTFLCIHHLLAHSEGGTEDDYNLVALCPTCYDIADYLPRLICLPNDATLKACVLGHLQLIATDRIEWTCQYEKWLLKVKKRAVESLQGDKELIHIPFYAVNP